LRNQTWHTSDMLSKTLNTQPL